MLAGKPYLYLGDVSKSGGCRFQLIQVDYDDLLIDRKLSLGDPVKCECDAILSHLSHKNIMEVEDKTEWTCEFCGHVNDISLFSKDQIKSLRETDESMTYNLEVVASKEDEIETNEGSQPIMVLFVIDISGSMGSYIPGRNMSLLEGVKMMTLRAAKYQYDNFPNNKLSLMTFDSSVRCYGDFSENGIKTKNGSDKEKNNWTDFSSEFVEPLPIKTSYEHMVQKIRSLRCMSSTALGPAIHSAVRYASRIPGSRVVVLTDGEANVGMGQSGDVEFYDEVGLMAKECGVIIDLMSVKDCHCNLSHMGHVALTTEGDVKMFNPKIDSDDFTDLLKVEQIATNVETKFIIPYGFRVLDATNEQETIKIIVQGNVVPNIQETFEIELKDVSKENIEKMNYKKIPYQAQVVYRKMNGSKYIRVYSSEIQAIDDDSIMNIKNLPHISNNHMKNYYKHRIVSSETPRFSEHLSASPTDYNEFFEMHEEPMMCTSATTDMQFLKLARNIKKK
ncbi:hypothetical protein SNEBB_010617 [Seison nebaliae]|nr:hypothetical protein SNEBB_010617 [Seison nebaliae]